MLVPGIETSCDETAVAVVDETRRIHANLVLSQIDEHFGRSPAEAIAAAHRIFSNIPFKEMTKARVLDLLGDPKTISDYGQPGAPDPDSPLVYRFGTGRGGVQYTLCFKNGRVQEVHKVPLE